MIELHVVSPPLSNILFLYGISLSRFPVPNPLMFHHIHLFCMDITDQENDRANYEERKICRQGSRIVQADGNPQEHTRNQAVIEMHITHLLGNSI